MEKTTCYLQNKFWEVCQPAIHRVCKVVDHVTAEDCFFCDRHKQLWNLLLLQDYYKAYSSITKYSRSWFNSPGCNNGTMGEWNAFSKNFAQHAKTRLFSRQGENPISVSETPELLHLKSLSALMRIYFIIFKLAVLSENRVKVLIHPFWQFIDAESNFKRIQLISKAAANIFILTMKPCKASFPVGKGCWNTQANVHFFAMSPSSTHQICTSSGGTAIGNSTKRDAC